jgi:hypothetical protein
MKLIEHRSPLRWCTRFALVFMVAIVAVGCSLEDIQEETEVEKTSININGTIGSAAVTGKNVQRGSIFGWISKITVTATASNNHTSVTDFDLVANGTPGASTVFTMDNVRLGSNTFTATTGTNVTPIATMTATPKATDVTTSSTGNHAKSQVTNKFATEKAKLQYAVYKETAPVVRTITGGQVDNVSIPMTTQNSRILAYFQDTDGNFTSFKVECYVGATRSINNNKTDPNGIPYYYSTNSGTQNAWSGGTLVATSATVTRTSGNAIMFNLSNATEIAGKSINYKITEVDSQGKPNYYWVDPVVMVASNTSTIFYHIQGSAMTIYKTY